MNSVTCQASLSFQSPITRKPEWATLCLARMACGSHRSSTSAAGTAQNAKARFHEPPSNPLMGMVKPAADAAPPHNAIV